MSLQTVQAGYVTFLSLSYVSVVNKSKKTFPTNYVII
nr:MAG TPA: hypothetical protein [Caudoviricetes sp.]